MYTQRPFSYFYYDDYWGLRNNPPPPVTILRRPEISINFVSDLNNRAVHYSPPGTGFFYPPDSPPNVYFTPLSTQQNVPYSPPNSPPPPDNGFFDFTDCKEDELEKAVVTSPSRGHHRRRKYFKK